MTISFNGPISIKPLLFSKNVVQIGPSWYLHCGQFTEVPEGQWNILALDLGPWEPNQPVKGWPSHVLPCRLRCQSQKETPVMTSACELGKPSGPRGKGPEF